MILLNKYNIISLLLVACIPQISKATALVDTVSTRVIINSLPLNSFDNPFYINQQTVITTPGIYAVNMDIDFDPTSSGQSCITIATSNVIFDLNRKSISLVDTNTQLGSIGITVSPNVQNIVIRSGSVNNMSAYGILVQDNVDVIGLNDLNINGAGIAGLFFDSTRTGSGIENVVCSNITVENVVNMDGHPAYGILLKYTSIADFEQCIVNNLQTTTGDCYGFKVKHCDSVRLSTCIATDNIGGGTRVFGFDVLDTSPCLLVGCLSTNNTCTSSDPSALAIGFNFNVSQNVVCSNCTAVSNNCTFTTIGFRLLNCTTAQLVNCQSLSNTSSLLDGIGFTIDNGLVNSCVECQALSNGGAHNGYGVLFNNNTFLSTIENSQIQTNTGASQAFGIALMSTNSCFISQNSLIGHISPGGGFGLFDDAGAGTTNSILGNFALKNNTNYSPSSPTIPIFNGPIATNTIPSPYQNVSL